MRCHILAVASALLLTVASCAQNAGNWLELPDVPEQDNDRLYVVRMNVDGISQRNYSFLWNVEHMTADWVAYPLCRGNIGEGKRTDAFGLCPLMPSNVQPELTRGYREGNCGRYSRGHQIPSADRRSYKANVQVFYGVNMTPQDENLNGGVWSVLENRVRGWARQCDTLYVVTGCTYDGYDGEYVLDNRGRHVAVPTGYYKVLLMRNGNTFHSCAFTFGNHPYSDNRVSMSMAISVSELEERTGIVFFPALKEMVGDERYLKIKSEDPKTQRCWGK